MTQLTVTVIFAHSGKRERERREGDGLGQEKGGRLGDYKKEGEQAARHLSSSDGEGGRDRDACGVSRVAFVQSEEDGGGGGKGSNEGVKQSPKQKLSGSGSAESRAKPKANGEDGKAKGAPFPP